MLVVTGADHHGIRPLMLAHAMPLPPQPLHWPPEVQPPRQLQPAGAKGRGRVQAQCLQKFVPLDGCDCFPRTVSLPTACLAFCIRMCAGSTGTPSVARSGGSLAAEQPWEDGAWVAPSEADSEEPPTCLEFATLEQGLRCAAVRCRACCAGCV